MVGKQEANSATNSTKSPQVICARQVQGAGSKTSALALETDNTKVRLFPVPTVLLVSANALSVSHACTAPSYGQLDFTGIEEVKTVGEVPKVTPVETGT